MSAVVLDAGVLIGLLEREDGHHHDAVESLARIADKGHELVASALTLSEALVRPARIGFDQVDRARATIVGVANVRVVDVNTDLAVRIAEIRAKEASLKTPDAVVVATARSIGANQILTTDERLARIGEAITPEEYLRR